MCSFWKTKVTLIRLIILPSVSDYKNIKLHIMTENFGNIITLDEACNINDDVIFTFC